MGPPPGGAEAGCPGDSLRLLSRRLADWLRVSWELVENPPILQANGVPTPSFAHPADRLTSAGPVQSGSPGRRDGRDGMTRTCLSKGTGRMARGIAMIV